ncbi:MAG: tRNA (cytidine(34)-2'-O)-methyltransferase [Acidobacteria bacterium]|nr:tRNA (cytidine(34)-2'-O)-methyltransferase [Acidobacteriota bacterium]
MNVVLIEPQIPPNTGNVARLCAATRTPLHLVGKLGFHITDRHLRRAGLDYWELADVRRYDTVEEFLKGVPESELLFFSKRAKRIYINSRFEEGNYLIFGNETHGLPEWLFERFAGKFWRIPLLCPSVRSLNLSSAVGIVLYEALRQCGKWGTTARE